MEDIMETTRSLLGPLITKPKLATKHLERPPFRFIHDIVTELMGATGFAEGVFQGEELNGRSIKAKEDKAAWLEKLVSYLEANGESVDVRIGKVVAGQEADRTNAMLQSCARVAMKLQGGGADKKEEEDRVASDRRAAEADARAAEERRVRDEEAAASRRRAAEEEDAERKRAKEREREAEAERKRAKEREKKAASLPSRVFRRPEEFGATGDMGLTQEWLQPLFSKPKLSEKHLSRPPFRFIHDIFTAVSAATGFASNLLPPELQVGKKISDKDEKLRFLEMLGDVVSLTMDTYTSARPVKIAAGAEPEKTNELLQMLFLAATRPVSDPAEAVARVQRGEKAQPDGSHVPKGSSAGAPKKQEDQFSGGGQSPSKKQEDPFSGGGGGGGGGRGGLPQKKEQEDQFSGGGRRSPPKKQEVEEPMPRRQPVEVHHRETGGGGEEENDDGGVPQQTIPSARSRLARPQTARRRPPKVKEETAAAAAATNPANGPPKVEGLLGENESGSEEEEEDTVHARGRSKDAPGQRGGKGKHTREILAKMGQGHSSAADHESKDNDNENDGGIRMGRIRAGQKGAAGRSLSARETEALREAIQELVRTANPLGKGLEYAREDMDEMKAELGHWREEARRRSEALAAAVRQSEDTLTPLEKELRQVEAQCRDVAARISETQAAISHGDARIRQIVSGIVHAEN